MLMSPVALPHAKIGKWMLRNSSGSVRRPNFPELPTLNQTQRHARRGADLVFDFCTGRHTQGRHCQVQLKKWHSTRGVTANATPH